MALLLALARLFAFFPRIFEQKRDCSQSKFSIANECECNSSPVDSATQMTTEAMDSLKGSLRTPQVFKSSVTWSDRRSRRDHAAERVLSEFFAHFSSEC